jgi:hypothetical protein
MKYVFACAAVFGAVMASAGAPAMAENLYTSNFGVGPNDGKDGWHQSSPYGQSPSEIGKLNNSGATFRIASPVESDFGLLTFSFYGLQDVYGANDPTHEADTFSLGINGLTVFRAQFGIRGGDDLVLLDTTPDAAHPQGVTFTNSGLGNGRTVVVPFKLLFQGFDPQDPIENTFSFTYSGLKTMNGDAFSITSARIDYERGVVPSPTPEPAAWGLMILGFGLAGATLRQGRRLRAAPL